MSELTMPALEDGETLRELVPLNDADRGWMVALGCEWPDDAEETAWLDDMNDLAGRSSVDARSLGPDEANNLRRDFYERLPTAHKAADRYRDGKSLPLPLTFIGGMREWQRNGVDIANLLENQAQAVYYRSERVSEWMYSISSIGLNAVTILNNAQFSIFSMAAENIEAKLMPMYAAARLQGIVEYKSTVHRYIEAHPDMLFRKPHYVRMLTRIAVERNIEIDFAPDGPDVDGIFSLARNQSAHAVAAAYVEHGSFIDSWRGLASHTRRYHDWEEAAVKGLLWRHRDLAVVKDYERGYPFGDAKECEAAYERHKRAIWRRRRDRGAIPTDWQGPSVLGDPQLTAGKAFGAAVDYDLPSDADLLRREFGIVEARERGDYAEEKRMRRALVVIALPWVVKIADECTNAGEHGDKIAVGSLALSRFTMEEYRPADGQWWYGYKEAAIETVMDVMAPYGPRFNGRDRQNIIEDRAVVVSQLGEPQVVRPYLYLPEAEAASEPAAKPSQKQIVPENPSQTEAVSTGVAAVTEVLPAEAMSVDDMATLLDLTPAAVRKAITEMEKRQGKLPSRVATAEAGHQIRIYGGRAVQAISRHLVSSRTR